MVLGIVLSAGVSRAEDWQRKASEMYPQLAVAGSAFSKKFQKLRLRREADNPKFFDNLEWPVLLAKECAAELGAKAKPGAVPSAADKPGHPEMPADQKLYVARCGRCHEAYSPGVDEMTWNRWIWKWKDKARLTDDEYDQLMAYARREREARRAKMSQ